MVRLRLAIRDRLSDDFKGPAGDTSAMADRLTPLDGSFLRVETENAHMHVAWCALLDPPEGKPGPRLEPLRKMVEARLELTPRFRRRLAYPPSGMGEPFWVDDESFAIERHVTLLCDPDDRPDARRFAALTDRALSDPLDRTRPLWRVYLAPKLADGKAGMVAKFHHALVDGKSAVEVALLLFDVTPDAEPAPAAQWQPEPQPGTARLAVGALTDSASESLRAAREMARMAGTPRSSSVRLYDSVRRAALTVGEDLLRPAPASYLNVPIGPKRTLVRHRAPLDTVLAIKRGAGLRTSVGARPIADRPARFPVTVNDVCLAVVAGALRERALSRGEAPKPLKAMVPVSVRGEGEQTALGNRISLAFVDLPVHVSTPRARLAEVHRATTAFKEAGRPAGAEAVFGALGMLPDALRTPAARMVGSARVYNLTVSNIPGPRFSLYVLGSELLEAYPVVPLAEKHVLSIGIFGYREHLFFGLYADPEAMPDVSALPNALNASLLSLRRTATGGRGRKRYAGELLRSTNSVKPPRARSASS